VPAVIPGRVQAGIDHRKLATSAHSADPDCSVIASAGSFFRLVFFFACHQLRQPRSRVSSLCLVSSERCSPAFYVAVNDPFVMSRPAAHHKPGARWDVKKLRPNGRASCSDPTMAGTQSIALQQFHDYEGPVLHALQSRRWCRYWGWFNADAVLSLSFKPPQGKRIASQIFRQKFKPPPLRPNLRSSALYTPAPCPPPPMTSSTR